MKKSKKPIVFAIILMFSGTLILLNNLGFLPTNIPAYIFTWKSLLILLGAIALIKKNWLGGSLFIGTGAYFLFPEIFDVSQFQFEKLWPALLIYLGVIVLLYYFFPPKPRFKRNRKWKEHIPQSNEKLDYMESTVILGGDFKKISSYDFKGGKLISIMGGVEIDLSNCCLSSEKNIIDIEVVMGGLTLIVPKEWNVIIEASSIMGGIFDEVNSYIDPSAQIIIRGNVIMGGVEIKRAA